MDVSPYLNSKFPAQLVRDAALFGPELMAAIYGPSRFTRVGAAAALEQVELLGEWVEQNLGKAWSWRARASSG